MPARKRPAASGPAPANHLIGLGQIGVITSVVRITAPILQPVFDPDRHGPPAAAPPARERLHDVAGLPHGGPGDARDPIHAQEFRPGRIGRPDGGFFGFFGFGGVERGAAVLGEAADRAGIAFV